jgi:hypothetical protein
MDLGLLVQWKMVLSSSELRLVQKGLRGVLKEEEKADALALQEKIMRERARQAEQMADEAAKAVANIEERNQ